MPALGYEAGLYFKAGPIASAKMDIRKTQSR